MITRAYTLPFAMDTGPALGAVAGALLDAVDLGDGVRLLGVSASGLVANGVARQLAFELGDAGVVRVGTWPGTGRAGRPGPGPALSGASARRPGSRRSWQEVTVAVPTQSGPGSGGARWARWRWSATTASPSPAGEAPWGPSAPEPPV